MPCHSSSECPTHFEVCRLEEPNTCQLTAAVGILIGIAAVGRDSPPALPKGIISCSCGVGQILPCTCRTKEMTQPCLVYLHVISLCQPHLPKRLRGRAERMTRRRSGCAGGSSRRCRQARSPPRQSTRPCRCTACCLAAGETVILMAPILVLTPAKGRGGTERQSRRRLIVATRLVIPDETPAEGRGGVQQSGRTLAGGKLLPVELTGNCDDPILIPAP